MMFVWVLKESAGVHSPWSGVGCGGRGVGCGVWAVGFGGWGVGCGGCGGVVPSVSIRKEHNWYTSRTGGHRHGAEQIWQNITQMKKQTQNKQTMLAHHHVLQTSSHCCRYPPKPKCQVRYQNGVWSERGTAQCSYRTIHANLCLSAV